MSLTCFLDIVGCVPEKIASKYTSLLPFLRNLFTTSTKEEIRDIAAVIFAIITVNTSEKSVIDKQVLFTLKMYTYTNASVHFHTNIDHTSYQPT